MKQNKQKGKEQSFGTLLEQAVQPAPFIIIRLRLIISLLRLETRNQLKIIWQQNKEKYLNASFALRFLL